MARWFSNQCCFPVPTSPPIQLIHCIALTIEAATAVTIVYNFE
jgi:hypothetical protein